MESSCECPVCCEVFDHKIRGPKILVTCGHSVCESCVRSLLSTAPGPSISCPECRTPCQIPDGQANKLPTNFAILKVVDSLCSECLDRKHTQRCDHCSLELCNICREKHIILDLPDLSDEMRNLREVMEHLQKWIDKEKDFKTIQESGEHIIEEMQESHKELIRQLDQEHEKNIAQVRVEIIHHTDLLLEWREQLMTLLLDCKMFMDQQRLKVQLQTSETLQDRVSDTKQKCQQKIEALRQVEASRPDPQYLAKSYKDINIEKILASCRAIVTSQQTQTDDNPYGCTIQTLDHQKVTYKDFSDDGPHKPCNICTDPISGNIFATCSDQHKVFVLTDTLQLVHSFGSQGQGDGEYDSPSGVAISDGKLYISDTNNHRICVTDTQGAFLYTFGSEGTGREHYNKPGGLSVDSRGLLYVCDYQNHRIKVTNKKGRYIQEFGQDVFGESCPWYISVSTDDKVAVTTSDGALHLFTTDGQHTHKMGDTRPHNMKATGVCFDGDGLIVSDYYGERLVLMSDEGEVLFVIGSLGQYNGQIWCPLGLALSKNTDVLVCVNGITSIHVPEEQQKRKYLTKI